MRISIAVSLLALTLSACGENSKSNSAPPPGSPEEKALSKHIEPGVDLTFSCPDTFKLTTVSIGALWNRDSQAWDVSFYEYDKNGQKMTEWHHLAGTPHETESWQMNIGDGTSLVAKLSQIGEGQAMLSGRGRIMQCTFN